MRGIVIPKYGRGRGQKCVECRRTLKTGECGFVHRVSGSAWNNELWWHRRCLEALLVQAPRDAEDYVDEFESLKEKAQKGELFK